MCPITQGIMVDPVIASDGHAYERDAIEEWLRRKGTSPVTREPLLDQRLTTSYTLRKLIHDHLTKEQIQQRQRADAARLKDPNAYDRQVQQQRSQIKKETLITRYPETYGRLQREYKYRETTTQPGFSAQELEIILTNFASFESLLTQSQHSLNDFLGIGVNARGHLLENLVYVNSLITQHHMPFSDYARLDYDSMVACTNAMETLCAFVQIKCADWPLLLQLSPFEYDVIATHQTCLVEIFKKFPEISFDSMRTIFYQVAQAEITPPPGFLFESGGRKLLHTTDYIISLFFSKPEHTDHLTIPELVAVLKKSPKEAVWSFLEVQGNVDKLFARISEEDYSAIGSSWCSKSPGGIGPLRPKPSTASTFEDEMGMALGHLKGHALYYERTKEHIPSLIHSLDDLKKVLKWLFPYQCKDTLERLQELGRWGKLIKTPNDLAQLLNYFSLEKKNIGLLMDFEGKDFYPNVPYFGKGEERSIKYVFLPSAQVTAMRGTLTASDLPTLTDEQWTNIEAGHVKAFKLSPIFEALNQRGITFKNEIHMTVLEVLDKKVSGEECSFLQRLLPNRARFEEALATLKPHRSTKDKAGLQQQINTLQDFLRQAMQPYLREYVTSVDDIVWLCNSFTAEQLTPVLADCQGSIDDCIKTPHDVSTVLQCVENLETVGLIITPSLLSNAVNTATAFSTAMSPLDLNKRQWLYEAMSAQISTLIHSVDDFTLVKTVLTPDQYTTLYRENSDKLSRLRRQISFA